jgi:hypothetical protein
MGSGSLEQDSSLSFVAMKIIEEQTGFVIRLWHQVSQRPLGSAWSFETGEASAWACCSTG